MVFDNADVLSPGELEAYLPPGRGGNILITSCNSTMRNLTSPQNSLEVNEMEENDAIELVLKASYLDLSSLEFQAEASRIVKELFYLPLAIDQAGAYIASGAYHTKKFRRGLNLMILTGPMQPIVPCFCSIYFLSSIMRESMRKYFLMLRFKKIMKALALNCHLPVLCWIGDYFF